jgi:hypothetical protein
MVNPLTGMVVHKPTTIDITGSPHDPVAMLDGYFKLLAVITAMGVEALPKLQDLTAFFTMLWDHEMGSISEKWSFYNKFSIKYSHLLGTEAPTSWVAKFESDSSMHTSILRTDPRLVHVREHVSSPNKRKDRTTSAGSPAPHTPKALIGSGGKPFYCFAVAEQGKTCKSGGSAKCHFDHTCPCCGKIHETAAECICFTVAVAGPKAAARREEVRAVNPRPKRR